MNAWFVYILQCADGTFYSGITTDLARREREHNVGRLGARYTRGRRPVKLVYSEAAANRSEAAQRECALKTMPRSAKLALIATQCEYIR